MRKLFNALAAVALLMVVGIGSLWVYVYFVQGPPLSYTNIPFPTKKLKVKAGDIVPVEVGRCNTSSLTISYTVANSAYNIDQSMSYVLPGERHKEVQMRPGCNAVISYLHRLPKDLPSGRYFIYGSARVDGTFRDYSIPFESGVFEVEGVER